MSASRTKTIAIAMVVALSLSLSSRAFASEPEPERWGRWVTADEGMMPLDVRIGLHVTHLSLRRSPVGDEKHGIDYGFDHPTVFVPELTFSAFAAKHLSVGLLLQPAGFGGQDAPATG